MPFVWREYLMADMRRRRWDDAVMRLRRPFATFDVDTLVTCHDTTVMRLHRQTLARSIQAVADALLASYGYPSSEQCDRDGTPDRRCYTRSRSFRHSAHPRHL